MATTKKAGDSLIPKKGEVIVAKDQSGAVAVIHKGEQTAEQWGQHVDAAMGSGHEVFKDGVRVETPPNASNAPPPRAVPVPSTSASNPDPMGDVVVPSNGATQRQVTEGGTPGTYHERPVLDAVVNGAKALATTMPLANPDGPVAGLKEAGDGLKDSASALGLTPAPVTEKKTDDKPKAAEEQKLAEAPAGLGGPGAGGGAPAVPEENAMDRAFAIINKNHALAAVEENKADTAHRLSLASTDMAITERKFADQMMQADQIQKQAEDSVQKHIDAIQAEQAKLDPTINRDKYWQEKSGAQIAAGALAAACFGFAGKGMDYLKMIQAEVDANVQAQQMSFDNARGNLKDQRQGFENQFERAMKQGLSRKAAIESVRIATISSMQAQIQAITQQGISDVGMANMQVIAEGLGGDLLDAHQKAQMEGVRMGKERSATFLNYAQAEAMRATARKIGRAHV